MHAPRLSKKGVQLENLKQAAPDMFSPYPVASRRVLAWKDMNILHYVETKAFYEAASVEIFPEFSSLPLYEIVQAPPELMWEHDGKCLCGRRSFLFSLCRYCLEEEAREKEESRQEEQFGEAEWSRPGPPSERPAPGATDILDEREAEDLSAAASLPNVRPCPRVRKGMKPLLPYL